jgi:hypothetical protein
MEWDTLSCWLAFAEVVKPFPSSNPHYLSFPPEMHWVRDLTALCWKMKRYRHSPKSF